MNEGNFNSNINKPEEQKDENENFQILEKNQLDLLRKENWNYSFILQRYNLILKEYQEKYSPEIYDKLIKEFESKEELNLNLNQRNSINVVRLISQYENKFKEQNDLIKNLREEKERLVLNNQQMLEEISEIQNEKEKIKNDYDEILKAMEERTKQKQIKDKSKTFPNMNLLNIKEENLGAQIDINNTQNNLNNNADSSKNDFYQTMNNFMKKENLNLKEKVDYEEMITKLKKEIDNLKKQLITYKIDLSKRWKKQIRSKIIIT